MANPGKMNRRITIQTRTYTRDASGGVIETWADAYDAWAELVNNDQLEKMVSDADRNVETKQFRIRYKSGLASGTNRILYQLKFYDIEGINEEGIRDRLLLKCRAAQSLEL